MIKPIATSVSITRRATVGRQEGGGDRLKVWEAGCWFKLNLFKVRFWIALTNGIELYKAWLRPSIRRLDAPGTSNYAIGRGIGRRFYDGI